MAVRSDCSASSGRTSSAGGVRRPARCSAASTSTISARRESSEARTCCSRLSSGRSRGLGLADAGLDAAHLGGDVDQLLVELGAVLSDRRDIGLQFLLQFGRLALLLARGLQFLLALLDGIGGNGAVATACGGAARSALPPAKAVAARDSRRTTRRCKATTADVSGVPRPAVSGTM